MTRSRLGSLGAALVALAATSALALAFWTAPGTGNATAASATLSAAAITVPPTAAGVVPVSWTQQAALVPASAASSSITYQVERRAGAGAFEALSTGGCSGPLPHGTTSCNDPVAASGSYSYRVVARLNSWTISSSEAGPVTVTVDTTPPTVTSIVRADADPTNAASVRWTVTFNEPVTGVDATDFALVRTGGLTGGAVSSTSGSGATRTVTATTGSGSGTLGLNLVDDDSILDSAPLPNPLGGAGAGNGNATGQTYTVDRTAPTVTSIARVNPTPTAAASVSWTVTFSESVSGVDATDFALVRTGGLTGGAVSSTSGSGATRTVTATTGSGSGTLGLNLVDDDSILDTAANPLGGAGAGNGNATGQTYTVDRQAPLLTSLQMLDTNANGKVDRVTATFDETLAATTATAPWTLANVPSVGTLASVSRSGSTATLTITEGTGAADTAVGSFTVTLAASAGGIRDTLGNQSSFAATAPLDRAGPVPVNLTDTSGLLDGLLQQNDTLAATFSEPIAGGVPSTTTITETRPASGNATLNITGFTSGALSMGSPDYLLLAGSVGVPGTGVVSGDGKTVTITAGACSLNCLNLAAGTGTTMSYLPAPGLVDAAGNATAGSRVAGFRIF